MKNFKLMLFVVASIFLFGNHNQDVKAVDNSDNGVEMRTGQIHAPIIEAILPADSIIETYVGERFEFSVLFFSQNSPGEVKVFVHGSNGEEALDTIFFESGRNIFEYSVICVDPGNAMIEVRVLNNSGESVSVFFDLRVRERN